MAEYIIIAVDMISALFFIGATYYAKKNYDLTKNISSYWLLLMIAFSVGILIRVSSSAEWWGFFPDFMDILENSLSMVAATIYAIVAVLTLRSLVQPIE